MILALIDSYFWPFNKSHLKINIIFFGLSSEMFLSNSINMVNNLPWGWGCLCGHHRCAGWKLIKCRKRWPLSRRRLPGLLSRKRCKLRLLRLLLRLLLTRKCPSKLLILTGKSHCLKAVPERAGRGLWRPGWRGCLWGWGRSLLPKISCLFGKTVCLLGKLLEDGLRLR